MESDETEQREIDKHVRQLFFMLFDEDKDFAELLVTIDGLPAYLKPVGQAFHQNLKSLVSTMTVPATLAIASIQQARFHQLHLAEIFRAKSDMVGSADETPGAELPEPFKSRALSRAREALAREAEAQEYRERFVNVVFQFLSRTARDGFGNVEEAARELLRQGVVLVWGSFEVLCRDLFVAHLNKAPREILKLLAQPDTKRRLQLRGLDFETLAENEFGVADKLGSIVAVNQDLSGLVVLKDIFTALFPNSERLKKALAKKDLWILNQRRHLIVHQRAIIDQQYLANTGDSLPLGERLSPTPKEIDNSLHLVRDAGIVLLKEVAALP